MSSAHDEYTDFLFAGGGLAGLSLACQIETAFPSRFQMLVADKERKNSNDRTWCFWEKEDNPYQDVVLRQWDHLKVEGPGWQRILDIHPYQYKMIRSRDLYDYIHRKLEGKPNIRFVYGDISDLKDLADGAQLKIDGVPYRSRWLFNSAIRPTVPLNHPRSLLQHFKGYFLTSDRDVFDPGIPVFMDFRVEQGNDVRFVYVIPFNKRRALAEYTVFSPTIWSEDAYDNQLRHYLENILKIGPYHIEEEEFGVIPMTDYPFPFRTGKHILHTGTAGGLTKASTGYTFVNVMRMNQRVVEAIRLENQPVPASRRWHFRYGLYDSILLDVLCKHRYSGQDIFRLMFNKTAPEKIMAFLGEESRFPDELRMFATFPQLPFIRGFLNVVNARMTRSVHSVFSRSG